MPALHKCPAAGELGPRTGLSFIRKEAWPPAQNPGQSGLCWALQEPLALTQKKRGAQSPKPYSPPLGVAVAQPPWLTISTLVG